MDRRTKRRAPRSFDRGAPGALSVRERNHAISVRDGGPGPAPPIRRGARCVNAAPRAKMRSGGERRDGIGTGRSLHEGV